MNIHFLHHVSFEGPALIENWANDRNFEISSTRLYDSHHSLPDIDNIDLLVILGGPMSVHDEHSYPWMTKEKAFLNNAIDQGIKILGICLGAQMIAQQLDAQVNKHGLKEIGWFPVVFNSQALEHPLLAGINMTVNAFHWHGESFDMPVGAIHLASSRACSNQGFIYKNRLLALQFHIEMNEAAVHKIISECSDEVVDGKFIQSKKTMLVKAKIANSSTLYTLLDNFLALDNLSD